MGALLVRRRTGLARDACVLVATRGHYRGLRLRGPVSAGTRWHARLDVVLLPGELRIAGNGGIWRYRVAEMVEVSADPETTGAVRVDVLDGNPLVVTVSDGGALLDGLSRQLDGYEQVLRTDPDEAVRSVRDHVVDSWFTSPVATLTPAIDLLNARCIRQAVAGSSDRSVDTTREGAHHVRVEVLRGRRRDLLGVGAVTVGRARV